MKIMPKKPSYEELEIRIQELEQAESEHKLSEEQLIHSHDLMDYIISHAQSAIAVHDKDLKYVYVSKRYLKEYKVKEQNIIGKHHYEVFPDLPQKWRDVHQRALAGEVLSAEEDPYFRKTVQLIGRAGNVVHGMNPTVQSVVSLYILRLSTNVRRWKRRCGRARISYAPLLKGPMRC